jgi:hypothetical protein
MCFKILHAILYLIIKWFACIYHLHLLVNSFYETYFGQQCDYHEVIHKYSMRVSTLLDFTINYIVVLSFYLR